jgi:hypothetical protein
MLDVRGTIVQRCNKDFGTNYTFFHKDNRVSLDITELSIAEFYKLSVEVDDMEEYDLMSGYEVKTIHGYDWTIKKGKERLSVGKIFKIMEHVGQMHADIHKPEIIYYRYDDKRMHNSYRRWIEFGGYRMINDDERIAMYYREKKDEIQK